MHFQQWLHASCHGCKCTLQHDDWACGTINPVRQAWAVTVPVVVPDSSRILCVCTAMINDYVSNWLDASMVQSPCQALQLLLVAVAGAEVV